MKTKHVMVLLICFIISSHVWKLHREDILKKVQQIELTSRLKK